MPEARRNLLHPLLPLRLVTMLAKQGGDAAAAVAPRGWQSRAALRIAQGLPTHGLLHESALSTGEASAHKPCITCDTARQDFVLSDVRQGEADEDSSMGCTDAEELLLSTRASDLPRSSAFGAGSNSASSKGSEQVVAAATRKRGRDEDAEPSAEPQADSKAKSGRRRSAFTSKMSCSGNDCSHEQQEKEEK